jgi:hypothetical protein
MRILFDHGTPSPLSSFLTEHTVKKTKDLGWDALSNGELLTAAETDGFEIFLKTDKNIRYQQNLADRIIAIVVPSNSRWPVPRLYVRNWRLERGTADATLKHAACKPLRGGSARRP